MKKKIIYITGNKFKVLTAEKILNPLGFEIEAKKINCPEIQANSIEEVAMYSSKSFVGWKFFLYLCGE